MTARFPSTAAQGPARKQDWDRVSITPSPGPQSSQPSTWRSSLWLTDSPTRGRSPSAVDDPPAEAVQAEDCTAPSHGPGRPSNFVGWSTQDSGVTDVRSIHMRIAADRQRVLSMIGQRSRSCGRERQRIVWEPTGRLPASASTGAVRGVRHHDRAGDHDPRGQVADDALSLHQQRAPLVGSLSAASISRARGSSVLSVHVEAPFIGLFVQVTSSHVERSGPPSASRSTLTV